jgi:hypothetical protein
MTNFLVETKEAINHSGHKPTDIVFIGSVDSGYNCNWDQFVKLAGFEYDSGFGGQQIASDLIIAFSDGASMKRGEYDGSEWWEYAMPFVMPEKQIPIETFMDPGGASWTMLEEMHQPGGKYGWDDEDD